MDDLGSAILLIQIKPRILNAGKRRHQLHYKEMQRYAVRQIIIHLCATLPLTSAPQYHFLICDIPKYSIQILKIVPVPYLNELSNALNTGTSTAFV
jgi:hypothetical protein